MYNFVMQKTVLILFCEWHKTNLKKSVISVKISTPITANHNDRNWQI